jgi:hypothetical protein
MNKTIKTYEDIYPLTVIQMRYGGKYVAFQTESDARVVINTQLNEEAMYDVKGYIEKQYFGLYGVGDNIFSALNDLIKKQSFGHINN